MSVRGTEGGIATVQDHRHYSAGGAARELGCSISLLDKLERIGAIPRVPRLEGSGRKVFTAADVESIREVIEQRRVRARGGAANGVS